MASCRGGSISFTVKSEPLAVLDKLEELRVCESRANACEQRILAQQGRIASVELGPEALRLLDSLKQSRGLLMSTCDRIRRDIVDLRSLQEHREVDGQPASSDC
jgi:hypothetical protein